MAFRFFCYLTMVVGVAGSTLAIRFVDAVVRALETSVNTIAVGSRKAVFSTIERLKAFRKKAQVALMAVVIYLWIMVHEWALHQLPYLFAVRCHANPC